jgi:hypothetical protein
MDDGRYREDEQDGDDRDCPPTAEPLEFLSADVSRLHPQPTN